MFVLCFCWFCFVLFWWLLVGPPTPCHFPLRSLPSDPPLLPGSTSLGYTLSFPVEFLHFFYMLPKVPDTNFQSFPLWFLHFFHPFSFQSYHIPWVTPSHFLRFPSGFVGFCWFWWFGRLFTVVSGFLSVLSYPLGYPLPSDFDGFCWVVLP